MKSNVLITGASIAGPALAWWLTRAGATVTVVERAPEFRDAGQNVDVRGAGRTVAQRMGLEDRIRELTTGEEAIAFVDENNRVKAEFPADVFGSSNGLTAELEILRRSRTALYEHTREDAEYIFSDRIHALDDQGDGVEVTFERGWFPPVRSGHCRRGHRVIDAQVGLWRGGTASSARPLHGLLHDPARRERRGGRALVQCARRSQHLSAAGQQRHDTRGTDPPAEAGGFRTANCGAAEGHAEGALC